MNEVDATILICTWNRAELLRATLQSIAAMEVTSGLRWDVLVVDNNSSDRTREVVLGFVDRFPVPLHYMFEATPGKSSAMNSALAVIDAPIIVFTDDDVRVAPHWLDAACRPLKGDDAGVQYTGGPVRPMWEEPPPAWFAGTGSTLWGTLAMLDYGDEPFIFEERRRVPLGVNWAIRRALLRAVGGFVPSLGRSSGKVLLGQELPEFFSRTRAAGARGLYVPDMEVHHHVPARRVTADYGRRWWYGKGVSRARMETLHPVTELGLDLRTVPTIAGIPRFLFGSAARDLLRWFWAVLRGDTGARIAVETQLCYFVGQVRERLRLARTPSTSKGATPSGGGIGAA
jgi:glycosyltransferase involved in cell wall biosynthesis